MPNEIRPANITGYQIQDLPEELQAEARKLDSTRDGVLDTRDAFVNQAPGSLSAQGQILLRAASDPLDPESIPSTKIATALVVDATTIPRVMALSDGQLAGASIPERVHMLEIMLTGMLIFNDARQQRLVDIMTSTPKQHWGELSEAIDSAGIRSSILGGVYRAEDTEARSFFSLASEAEAIDDMVALLDQQIFRCLTRWPSRRAINLPEAKHLIGYLNQVTFARLEAGLEPARVKQMPEYQLLRDLRQQIAEGKVSGSGLTADAIDAVLEGEPPPHANRNLRHAVVQFYFEVEEVLVRRQGLNQVSAQRLIDACREVAEHRGIDPYSAEIRQLPEFRFIEKLSARIEAGEIHAPGRTAGNLFLFAHPSR